MTGVINVADLVRTAAVRGPDHPAFIDAATGDTLTWAEVDAATDVEAHRLRGAGLQPGDRVAVRLPTSAEFAVAVFGALRAGAVVVPVSNGGPTRELTRVLDDSGATLLVGAPQRHGLAPAEVGEADASVALQNADTVVAVVHRAQEERVQEDPLLAHAAPSPRSRNLGACPPNEASRDLKVRSC